MTEPTAEFGIKLRDETSGTAAHAAGALERLRETITADTRALSQMQAAMRRLKGGTSTNVAAFRELRDKISATKASLASAESQFVSLGGSYGKVGQGAAQAGGSLNGLLGTVQRMPGPLGSMAGRLSSIGGLVAGGTIAAGIAAIAAACVALVAASAAAVAALLRYGVAQSDARRSELLRMEGLRTLRTWMGRVRASSADMQAAMDRAGDSTNVGRGALETYARQLGRMGLQGDRLARSLEAMAVAEQVQGTRGSARFRAMIMNARLTGRSVDDVTNAYMKRLGPIARAQMLSLGNQQARLRRNLDRLFSGLRIEGFLSALNEITSLFSQSTVEGRALKQLVEVIFQPLLDGLTEGGPLARRFFQGMIIGAQTLVIWTLRLANYLKRTFGGSEILRGLDLQKVALYAGIAAVGVFVAAVVVAGAVTVALASALASVVAIGTVFAAPFIAAGAALVGAVLAGRALARWFLETDWSALGARIADGLVQGIRDGAARVTSAVQNLATSARSALVNALQIRSPSRVFAGLGEQISAGLAMGVDAGTGQVDAAVTNMVAIPDGLGRGAGASVSIGDIHVHAQGGDAGAIAGEVVDQIVALLEGAGIQIGAPA